MKKKKIIFSVAATLLLLISSFGIYNCYSVVYSDTKETVDFTHNYVLYDILHNIYALSYQLDTGTKNEKLAKYITADRETSSTFYTNYILHSKNVMNEKTNIKYYAQRDNQTLGNTTDDIKNIDSNKSLKNKYQWYLKVSFNELGEFSYDSLGCSKSANQNFNLIWNDYKDTYFSYFDINDEDIHNPSNITFYFAVPKKITGNSVDAISTFANNTMHNTDVVNIFPIVAIAIVAVSIFMLLYPYKVVSEVGFFKYPSKIKTELLLISIMGFGAILITMLYGLLIDSLNGYYIKRLSAITNGQLATPLLTLMNVFTWTVLLLVIMFTVYYIKSFFKEGFVKSFKEKTISYWIYTKARHFITNTSFDLSDNINKPILKTVAINAVVVYILLFSVDYAIYLVIVYSIILFIIIKKQFIKITKDYNVLYDAVYHISDGDFNVEINEDIGVFTSLGKELTNIKNGFETAVSEEVKSQNMKTELISNVSHDLKTPLTSIITYVDLLKNEELNDEKRAEYISTIDCNSLRLKNLIEDLFEVSKVNSGDINLNIVDVDIISLIQQAKLELNDQLASKNLTFKTSFPNEKIVLQLDSLKTYRIFENLLTNISKYALENTRVYIEVINIDDEIEISFKNISADEIMVSEDKLVERFVQGDVSRNTSGSGLGLAIAKSFTEIQKGSFKVAIDGDLFKVIVIFKK